jgi:hypothetical protein
MNNRPRRILSGSQAFGYGPSSKLVTIASHLQQAGVATDFCGEGIARSFAELNRPAFGTLRAETDVEDIVPEGYDAVLSLMSPAVAAWGYAYGVPVAAVDSLYWLWRWPEDRQPAVQRDIAQFRGAHRLGDLLAYIETLPRHVQQFANHLMAERSYIQRYPGMYREDRADRVLNLVEVGPIVDRSYYTDCPRDTVLISFAGMINPLISDEDIDKYFRLVNMLLEPALAELEQAYQVVYVVNPVLDAAARQVFRGTITALSHQEMLRTMARSIAVVTPPGITTFYECLAYRTPALSLPEQHYGHFPNYERLAHLSDTVQHFRQAYPEALVSFRVPRAATTPPEQVRELYVIYQRLLDGEMPDALADMQHTLYEALLAVRNPDRCAAYAAAQLSLLEPLVGTFCGAEDVADGMKEMLGLKTPGAPRREC